MNFMKILSTAVIVGSLVGSAAFAAPRASGIEGRGQTKMAPAHKAKKKTTRRMAHSEKKVVKPNLNKPRLNKPGQKLVSRE